jgi:Tat protein translocase TatC
MAAEENKMTFLEHLEELRRRLIYCVVAVAAGIVVCWIFREEIRAFLEAPLYLAWSRVEGLPPPQPLSFTSLVEPFMAYLKLSAIGGVFLAVPAILYNLWKFVAPGLYKRERRIALPFVFVSSLLFLGGSTLCYTYVFPVGIQFFLAFAAGGTAEDHTAAVVTAPAATVAPPAAEVAPPAAPAPPESAAAERDAGAAADEGDGGVTAERAEPLPGRAPDRPAAPVATAPVAAPAAPATAAAAPPAEKSLWDLALEKLLREGCGAFAAAPDPAGGALLRFSWHAEECGAAPEITGLERDGAAVEATWEEAADAPAGYAVLEARDTPAAGGRHEYAVHAISRGDTGRKLAPILMLSDYLSFSIKLLFAFGILFELPVLIVFLSLAGIVTSKQLIKFSRWFIVLALIVGAVMTTPDVITQVMFAGPLIVLYFISALIAYIIERKRAE